MIEDIESSESDLASEVAAQRAEDLAAASELLATRGAVEMAVGAGAGDLVRVMVVEGASDLAAGAAKMTASESLDDLAQALAVKAE